MEHLQYLKEGFEASQKKFQDAQAKLQAMQTEFQVIAQEFNAWQTLYRAELAKHGEIPAGVPNSQVSIRAPKKPKMQNNQTEVIRTVLRNSPNGGMTPNEIWTQVESQLANRTYLYSVLKRLKERGDVIEKRGKYFPKPKTDSVAVVVQ